MLSYERFWEAGAPFSGDAHWLSLLIIHVIIILIITITNPLPYDVDILSLLITIVTIIIKSTILFLVMIIYKYYWLLSLSSLSSSISIILSQVVPIYGWLMPFVFILTLISNSLIIMVLSRWEQLLIQIMIIMVLSRWEVCIFQSQKYKYKQISYFAPQGQYAISNQYSLTW